MVKLLNIRIRAVLPAFALCLVLAATTSAQITSVEVISDLSSPVYLCAAPGDNLHVYVIEQEGRILRFDTTTWSSTVFLDIRSQVSYGGERGLLGMAFHPDFETNGRFYVNYTYRDGSNTYTAVSEFRTIGFPPAVVSGSEDTILVQFQPQQNHNAGMLAFSPVDGYLYVGFGDGGGAGDPSNYAQTTSTWLGKMLRIDVNTAGQYAVPTDNPFVDDPNTLDEIWAIGLRNPWRYSFDRLTGDLWIADVGQGELEEVDVQTATSDGGINYGWRRKEGTECYNPATNCDPGGIYTDPIHEYTHGGDPFRCSITGGYVYRGCAVPSLHGSYFFADYCSGNVWSVRFDGQQATNLIDWTSELGTSSIVSFGEDGLGELYIISHNGTIYKIVPTGASSCSVEPCCEGDRGNVNGDPGDFVDVADIVYLVEYSFSDPSGPPPPCTEEADVNGNSSLDVADVVYLVEYAFSDPSGPAPEACN